MLSLHPSKMRANQSLMELIPAGDGDSMTPVDTQLDLEALAAAEARRSAVLDTVSSSTDMRTLPNSRGHLRQSSGQYPQNPPSSNGSSRLHNLDSQQYPSTDALSSTPTPSLSTAARQCLAALSRGCCDCCHRLFLGQEARTNSNGTDNRKNWQNVQQFWTQRVQVQRWQAMLLTPLVLLVAIFVAALAAHYATLAQLGSHQYSAMSSESVGGLDGQATVVELDKDKDVVYVYNDTAHPGLHYKKKYNPYLDDYDLIPEGLEEYEEEEEEETPPYYRLPSHLEPYFYKVHLLPLFEGPNKYHSEGRVEIDVICVSPSDNVTLDQFDLIVDEESLSITDVENGRKVAVKGSKYNAVAEFYIISLEETLIPGRHYHIELEFISHLNDRLAGFYRSYYNYKGETRVMAVSQFEATEARRAFPCFDEPHLKANFSIILGRKSTLGWTAISNMPLAETFKNEKYDGYVWDRFETTPKMSTYLVALCVSQLAFQDNPGSKFRVWTRPEALHMAHDAVQVGMAVLDHYGKLFAAPYPLPKMDFVAVPDFAAGAMENWGLVTFREQHLLFDGKLHSAEAKFQMVTSVAHEMAHQWFGDLVTLKWWTDLWLNEGFATFMEYKGAKLYGQKWPMDELFLVDLMQNALGLDCLRSSHAVMTPVEHPDEIAEIFDVIAYEKGAALLRMMEHSLGSKTFFDGVKSYVTEFSYKNAESNDLWEHIEREARKNPNIPKKVGIKEVMDNWTLKNGYPVVTLVRNYSDPQGVATISQKQFFLIQEQASNATNETDLWWIPINFSFDGSEFKDTRPDVWFPQDFEMTVHDPSFVDQTRWVIMNAQAAGFYRCNYDNRNWELIRIALMTHHESIHVNNRAQLIDDALSLARAGLMDYGQALELTKYLIFERNYAPWKAALNDLQYIGKMLIKTGGYGAFKDYMKYLILPFYEELSFEPAEAVTGDYEDISVPLKESLLMDWACLVEIPSCLSYAKSEYRRWMDNYDVEEADKPIINPNHKDLVYCNGITYGASAEWEHAWEHYGHTAYASEVSNMIVSLACTKEVWTLNKYLEITVQRENSTLRRHDTEDAFSYIATNVVGTPFAFNFLKSRWDEVMAAYGGGRAVLETILEPFGAAFNTEGEVELLKELREDHVTDFAAFRAFDQAIENARINTLWMEHFYEKLVTWFEDNKKDLKALDEQRKQAAKRHSS